MIKIETKIWLNIGIVFLAGFFIGGVLFGQLTGYAYRTSSGIQVSPETASTKYPGYECCMVAKSTAAGMVYEGKITFTNECERMYLGEPYTIESGLCDLGNCCRVDGEPRWSEDVGASECSSTNQLPIHECREAYLPR